MSTYDMGYTLSFPGFKDCIDDDDDGTTHDE